MPLLSIALLLLTPILAVAEEWRLLTDTRNARDIVAADSRLWLATEGGLVEFTPEGGMFRTHTTLDGLSGVGVLRLAPDSAGAIWLAFDNRTLLRWDGESGVTHTVSTLSQQSGIQSVNDIAISSRGLFVATNRGVSLITYVARYDQWVWFEEYRRIGSFSPDISARTLLVDGDYLWVGTDQGVGRGDLTSPKPLDWVNYTTAQGLPGAAIRDLVMWGGALCALTSEGVAQVDAGRWRRLHPRKDFTRLFVNSDTLVGLSPDGVYAWTGSAWQRWGSFLRWTNGVAWDDRGRLWAGLSRNGLSPGGVARLEDTTWVVEQPPGPVSNYLLAAAFRSDGTTLFVGGKGGGEFGLSQLSGDEWRIWSAPTNVGTPFNFQHRSVAMDLDGGVWVGTFLGGVARYDANDSVTVFNAESSTGERLNGYSPRHRMVLAPAVAADTSGNVWIVNRGALNGRVLVCVPREFIRAPADTASWIYFHRSNFGAVADFDLLAIDGRSRKWIASTANDPTLPGEKGIYVLDDEGTLRDSTDDDVWGPIPGLPSTEVLSLKWDPAGFVWAGSSRGAYYAPAYKDDLTGASFTQVYAMREIPIYSIDVDPTGNKWFGTEFGASILSPDLYTVVRRITSDPPDRLPSSRVQMVAIDPYSGWAYIGTSDGTVALHTPYRDYGQDIASVTVEPNPFNPNRGTMTFTGSSLAGAAGARIYTPDGRLVRSLSHDRAALGWDGRDDSGRPVADGVYLILTHSGNGQAAQGKVAVLRR